MELHSLVRSKGLKDKLTRRGRGNSSGRGNYSGRGCKGQKARSGGWVKPFFEGGQTSVVQRMPKKRGFKRYYKLVDSVEVVNLAALEKDERIVDTVNKALLVELHYLSSLEVLVKILGNGDFSKKLSFEGMDKFSATAKTKIEKAGWTIQ